MTLGSPARLFWPLVGTLLLADCSSKRSIEATMPAFGTAALSLVVAGAVGNLLDRLISSRGVVDFIDVGIRTWRFYIFNVADMCVSIGACALVYALWRGDRPTRDPAFDIGTSAS